MTLDVFARPGFLTGVECVQLCAEMDRAPHHQGVVRDPDRPDADSLEEIDRRAFDCEVAHSTTRAVVERIARIAPEIGAHFGLELTQDELPHFVRYEPGGFYRAHRDLYRDVVLPDPLARRRVSVVVFLNEPSADDATGGFDGGALRLCSHDAEDFDARVAVDVSAERGLLVAFRSDTWHEVTPITRGLRYTIVALLHAP